MSTDYGAQEYAAERFRGVLETAQTSYREMTAESAARWAKAEESGAAEDYSDAEEYARECRVQFELVLATVLDAAAHAGLIEETA